MGKLRKIEEIILVVLVVLSSAKAQTIYLNSYGSGEASMNNCIFKINLENKTIEDSLVLAVNGSFCLKNPVPLASQNRVFLISFLVNGLYAKNTQLGSYTVSHFFILNKSGFNLVYQDSLPRLMVGDLYSLNADTLTIEFLDEVSRGWKKSKQILNRSNRLIEQNRLDFTQQDYESPMIGEYVDPDFICTQDTINCHWGFKDIGDSSYVNLIAVYDSTVINESRIAERTSANIIVGCNVESNKIYSFILPYKLFSYNPIIESSPDIIPRVLIINPNGFETEIEINIDLGDVYLGYETGTMKSIGSYIYYFFFKQDGIGRFDPAYLLIFDTRTNEASWLRVGWR